MGLSIVQPCLCCRCGSCFCCFCCCCCCPFVALSLLLLLWSPLGSLVVMSLSTCQGVVTAKAAAAGGWEGYASACRPELRAPEGFRHPPVPRLAKALADIHEEGMSSPLSSAQPPAATATVVIGAPPGLQLGANHGAVHHVGSAHSLHHPAGHHAGHHATDASVAGAGARVIPPTVVAHHLLHEHPLNRALHGPSRHAPSPLRPPSSTPFFGAPSPGDGSAAAIVPATPAEPAPVTPAAPPPPPPPVTVVAAPLCAADDVPSEVHAGDRDRDRVPSEQVVVGTVV